MTRKAHCCCGACSIEVEGEPVLNSVCHCGNCKRRTGSAFGWSAYFADEQVDVQAGQLRPLRNQGPKPQRRWFCATCGTTLLWKAGRWPAQTGIAGGCFTETPLPAPAITVSNGGRCAWLDLPADWRTSI